MSVLFTLRQPNKDSIFMLNVDILQRVTDAESDTGSMRQEAREVPDVLEKDVLFTGAA